MLHIAYDAENVALYHPEQGASQLRDEHWPGEVALAAELSRLAYLRAESDASGRSLDELREALQAGGFDPPKLLVDSPLDAYGFATCNQDGLLVLAFRGTQADHYEDFLSNIQAGFARWPAAGGHGRVHEGFGDCAMAMLKLLVTWLEGMAARRKRLLICGHSLGGAIATLLAVPTGANALITFGCPRVGDDDFAGYVSSQQGLTITRVVNCCDAVPMVPFPFMGYEHVGNALHIDLNGLLLDKPTYAELRADRHAARHAYAAIFAADPLHRVPVRQFADHAPINYIRAFWP